MLYIAYAKQNYMEKENSISPVSTELGKLETVRIEECDSIEQMAKKIFEGFKLHQSCRIGGTVVQKGAYDRSVLRAIGELVCEELRELDINANTYKSKTDKRIRRKKNVPLNSIGGSLAHKIFRYERKIVNKEISYTIWRVQ